MTEETYVWTCTGCMRAITDSASSPEALSEPPRRCPYCKPASRGVFEETWRIDERRLIVTDANTEGSVAICDGWGWRVNPATHPATDEDWALIDQRDALLAAAPELARALKRLLSGDDMTIDDLNAARAALMKARGQ